MNTIDTVVIGAGHAGLAVSRLLTDAGREHVVLDRGRVAERWRTERWDSLRLLTPNWMTRLPGWPYAGADPDGFMSAGGFVAVPGGYAASFDAPVSDRTTVLRARRATAQRCVPGGHRPRHLACPPRRHRDRPARRAARAGRPGRRARCSPPTATATRHSSRRAGCSSSAPRPPACRSPTSSTAPGARSSSPSAGTPGCRAATAAWTSSGGCERTGRLARTIDEVPDPVGRPARAVAAAGRPRRARATRADVDLAALQARGVRLVGRFAGMRRGTRTVPAPTWPRTSPPPNGRMHRAARRDRRVHRARRPHRRGAAGAPAAAARRAAADRSARPRARRHRHGRLVATGYRPRPPVAAAADHRRRTAAIRQHRGVTPAPGVYVVGQRFQHRRDSGFIDGARHDARAVVRHLLTRFDVQSQPASARRGAGSMSSTYDVVVVGGRVAGASTALLLARAGARVALVDRAAYGTDTLSTHGLMRAGVLQLSRWGLLDEVVAAGTPPIRRHDVPLRRRRVGAGLDPSQRRRRRALRAAPPPARPDPRGRGRRGRGATCGTRPR